MAGSIQKIHKTLTQMQKNLECSICLELLQDPVLTKCDHHFCNFCILALLQSKRRPSAPCPLCKEPVTKRSLTTHSTLKGIVTAFRNVVTAVEDDTGQKCTPPRGPLPFSQPEPPSQRPKREEKKVQRKSNVRRGKSKNIPVIPIYLDDEEEEEDMPGQSSEKCPPLKNNLNIVSSFPSPRKTKKTAKKSNSRKGKENTQQSETEDDQEISGQSDILEVIANESLGQNGTTERTKQSHTGRGDGGGVVELQPADRGVLPSTVNNEKNVAKDPYEFIASQRTPRKLKKRKVKEKKKKPWEYSFGKISRKKKGGEGAHSERWAESQSDDDDYEDSSYVHREDIENEEEREEDENGRDDASKKKGRSCRKEENRDGEQEVAEINEKGVERIDSSDEEGIEEMERENGEEIEESVIEGVDEMGDHRAVERRGRKMPRNAASRAMDAIKGQVISQSSGEGSAPAGSGHCHGDQNAGGIDVTADSYGRSLIDFGAVHRGKDKFPVIERTEECNSPLKTKQSESRSSASHFVNGNISQEFPLSQPPMLNRNHGDKMFAKAYGRGKIRSPGEKVVAQPSELEDDGDLPDVMNIDIDSDDEGKANSQELFVGDVLDPTPPGDAGRTVGGDFVADGGINQEKRKDDQELEQQEAVNDEENMVKDVCNGMLEEEGQFDDLEMEVEAFDQTMDKTKGCAGNAYLRNRMSSIIEDGEGLEDRKENASAGDEDETVLRGGKKRESLKGKMRNKDGLTAGETANIATNYAEEHLQSDWELALKLAQEFGSVPPNLEVRHSKRVSSKKDENSTEKRGRKMRQLQIQNVPDTSDRGQHSRRARSRRNMRSKVAEESDDVDIDSFQDDSRGDASGENRKEVKKRSNEREETANIKNARLDSEKESSSVQCVPETPHVVAKVMRGSLSSGKKKTKNKRKKEADVEVESGDVVVIGDGESKTAGASRALESQEVSEVPKKQQQAKSRNKENFSDELSHRPAENGETVDDGSTTERKRRSSRLSKSLEEQMNSDKCKESENKRKVDSDAGMEEEDEKEIGMKGASGEGGKGRRKSARLSKSQDETKSDERKERRKSNSESDVKEGAEAEGIVIVVDDESDDEDVDGDSTQVRRTSSRLLSKSQEKKMEKNGMGDDSTGKGRGKLQGRTGKSQAAPTSKEERQDLKEDLSDENKDVRGGSGQRKQSLGKRKEDCTPGDRKDKRKTSSQCSDKVCKKLDDSKGGCLDRKDSDRVSSLQKGRKGRSITDEALLMDETMRADAASSSKPSRVKSKAQVTSRGTRGLSGSTTESIELDNNPAFAQPDGDFTSEKSPHSKNIEREKLQKGRENASHENLSVSGFEKVDDVAKEEETKDKESHSLRETRKSKRNNRDVQEGGRKKKDSFDESEKRFSESLERKKSVQEKKRGEKEKGDEQDGSLHLLNEENKADAEVQEDERKSFVGLSKSKLRSRSSGRKGKGTPGKENLEDCSSSMKDEEEEPVRRSSRRQKKGKAEDEANVSRFENNEEKVCESVEIDQNRETGKVEASQQEEEGEEQQKHETRATKDTDEGEIGEKDEGSVSVVKGDPTSPDIFTMHLEASEQEVGGSVERRNREDEPTKEEKGAWGEGDGGETPKTSKRKKKKRKTFSFGNEANLVKGSQIDDDIGGSVREEAEKNSSEVQKSGSTTDADAGLELTEDKPQSKGDDSSYGQFVPATEGASESHGNLSDQIPLPRRLLRQRKEKYEESLESQPDMQNEKLEKEDLFSEEVVSIKRISSLKSRGKRQVAERKDDSEMSTKRFCSDSQVSLNSGEEESMVPPTPPVTTSLCQTDALDGSENASKQNSHSKGITEGEGTTKKVDSLVQAFEKIKKSEEKGSGSNQEDKIASSLSSPSISLFQDVEMREEQEVGKGSGGEVAGPVSCEKSPEAFVQSETDIDVPGKEVHGNKTSKKDNDSHGSSPEDLPDVLGDGDEAASCGDIQENIKPKMSKNNVADLDRDVQEENEEKDKFVQPLNKPLDEEEPLFDDEYPVSPASSIGRHNLTSASSVLSSQSDLMTSQQQERAKKVLENMEKEIAEMERALAEEEDVEKKDEISDEDEEETDENERKEVTKGKPERRSDVINTSQEAKDGEDIEDGLEGVESIDLSSDEDEMKESKKLEEEDRGRRRKTPDRRTSGCGRKNVLKKYGKYENLDDIDDDDIALNVKQNLTEMAEAEKSLDSLLKAHAARRQEEEKEEKEEKSGSEDEEDHEDRPSTPPVPSPSSSPPRSPSPAPLLSQNTLVRRLSSHQKNLQKAEEIVKSYSEERPVTSQKRRRVVIEDSDSESEDEVQYRNKRRKSLKLDSPESCDADEEKVKGQPDGKKVESPCMVTSPTQKNGKENLPKTTSEKRDMYVAENHQKISPKGGGMQHDSPDRKKVTPQTSSSGSGGSSSKKKPRKGETMSLVATGLNKQKLKMVDQLCKKAGCKFSSVFIPSTTHVIVNAGRPVWYLMKKSSPILKNHQGDNLTCERTLKYFQGISARRWVISFQWVQESLSASRLLPLEKYEIRGDSVNGQNHCGPRRARLWKGPPLLGDYNLFCLEPYTGLNKDQLEGLLTACGGSVYQHPSEMPQEDGKENFIIAQHDAQEEEMDFQALYEKYQAKVVSREWVLDSIAVYTTQPITDYLLCDVTECDDVEDLMSDDEF